MGRTGWFAAGALVGLAVGLGLGSLRDSARGEAPATPTSSTSSEGPSDAPPSLRGAEEGRPPEAPSAGGNAQASSADPVGVLLYGAFLDPEGNGVAAQWLFLTDPERPENRRYAGMRGGARGYSVTGLRPGTWTLDAKAADYRQVKREVVIGTGPVQRLDLVLEPSTTLQVHLETPDGTSLREALAPLGAELAHTLAVVATPDPPESDLPMTDLRGHPRFGQGTWSDGRRYVSGPRQQSLAEGVDGEIEVSAAPPFHVSLVLAHVILATERVAEGQDEVTFVLAADAVLAATATVRLRVVDAATSDAIPDARVTLYDRQTGGGGERTDDDGRLTIERRKPGILDLGIGAAGYASYRRVVRVVPGIVDLGRIALSRGTVLRGQVVDEAGEAGRAQIVWENLDLRHIPCATCYDQAVLSDPDGSFEAGRLGAGRHLVWALGTGTMGYVEVHSAHLGEEPVRIVVHPTHRVTIDAAGMSPTKRYVLTILDGDLPICARRLRGPYVFCVDLPRGSYTHELHEDLDLVGRGAIEVDGQTPVTIRVP